jgi:hypothetical protein
MKIIYSIGTLSLAAVMLASSAIGPSLATECYEQAPLRPAYRTYTHRDVVEPGVYTVWRSTSLYGWHVRRVRGYAGCCGEADVHERVLLHPYRNYAHFYRPHIRYWRERIAIRPESYGCCAGRVWHGC